MLGDYNHMIAGNEDVLGVHLMTIGHVCQSFSSCLVKTVAICKCRRQWPCSKPCALRFGGTPAYILTARIWVILCLFRSFAFYTFFLSLLYSNSLHHFLLVPKVRRPKFDIMWGKDELKPLNFTENEDRMLH